MARKVYIVLSDDRERWAKRVLGVYKKRRSAYKRANAYMHNNNKDIPEIHRDYKTLSPKKFFERYCGSLWIQYATIDFRSIS